MEFLKKMKSRETIEMALKTVFAVVVVLILAILMEGMIYGIYMDKINKNHPTSGYSAEECIAYCEEMPDGEFKIYLHNPKAKSWSTKTHTESLSQIENHGYSAVEFRKPNAFDVSITGTHYIVLTVFIAGVLGFYGWRFYKLNKEYKAFEKKYKKTGKVF